MHHHHRHHRHVHGHHGHLGHRHGLFGSRRRQRRAVRRGVAALAGGMFAGAALAASSRPPRFVGQRQVVQTVYPGQTIVQGATLVGPSGQPVIYGSSPYGPSYVMSRRRRAARNTRGTCGLLLPILAAVLIGVVIGIVVLYTSGSPFGFFAIPGALLFGAVVGIVLSSVCRKSYDRTHGQTAARENAPLVVAPRPAGSPQQPAPIIGQPQIVTGYGPVPSQQVLPPSYAPSPVSVSGTSATPPAAPAVMGSPVTGVMPSQSQSQPQASQYGVMRGTVAGSAPPMPMEESPMMPHPHAPDVPGYQIEASYGDGPAPMVMSDPPPTGGGTGAGSNPMY